MKKLTISEREVDREDGQTCAMCHGYTADEGDVEYGGHDDDGYCEGVVGEVCLDAWLRAMKAHGFDILYTRPDAEEDIAKLRTSLAKLLAILILSEGLERHPAVIEARALFHATKPRFA